MGEHAADVPAMMPDDQLLAWENLGAHPPARAFRQSLRELLFRPSRFFDKMATSGGLREPLMFAWIETTLMVLLGFPLALSYFALTAPRPMEVSVAVYNMHLLAPRVTGFAVVLLPVVLVAAAVSLVAGGSLFHLGARLFGARNWEGSVSIWCYAKSAGAAPLAVAEGLLCALCIVCYPITLLWPEARGALGSVAETSLLVLGGLGVLMSAAVFFIATATGCMRVWGLERAEGAAAALAGALVAGAPTLGVALAFRFWGAKEGWFILLAAVVLLGLLAAAGRPGREKD